MALPHCRGVNTQERADNSILELFCLVDDFCQHCQMYFKYEDSNALPEQAKGNKRTRNRPTGIAASEIMSILVFYHMSPYKNFKMYYQHEIRHHRKKDFPHAPSYSRFIELIPRVLFGLLLLMVGLFGDCTGYSFVDSTKIEVCNIKREHSNKVFKNVAKKGKSSMGWFYGFKLHLLCNDHGDLLWIYLTTGNIDDRVALEHMMDCEGLEMFGKIFGDKGYISARLFKKFIEEKHVNLVTSLRENMKSKLPVSAEDALYLRKRAIIESINDQLKNVSQIQHTRHRSQTNFLINLICGLIAYSLQPKRPSLHRKEEGLAPAA